MKFVTRTLTCICAFSFVVAWVPMAHADNLPAPPEEAKTPETSAGWQKLEDNPVLGGNLGTCFDVSVLREDDMFRMWFSWRPKAGVALVESRDGVHWSEPTIVLAPNPKTDWEERINRPVVLKRDGTYHMWYAWDYDACYKPYAIFHDGRWMLWYNGRKGSVEQIGLATHAGRELWPQPNSAPASRPSVLKADTFRHYVDDFNRHDTFQYGVLR